MSSNSGSQTAAGIFLVVAGAYMKGVGSKGELWESFKAAALFIERVSSCSGITEGCRQQLRDFRKMCEKLLSAEEFYEPEKALRALSTVDRLVPPVEEFLSVAATHKKGVAKDKLWESFRAAVLFIQRSTKYFAAKGESMQQLRDFKRVSEKLLKAGELSKPEVQSAFKTVDRILPPEAKSGDKVQSPKRSPRHQAIIPAFA